MNKTNIFILSILFVVLFSTELFSQRINEVYMIEVNTYGSLQQRQLLIWGFSDKIREMNFDKTGYKTILGIGVQHYECENMFNGAPNRLKVEKRGEYFYWEYRPGILFRTKNYRETKTMFDAEVNDRERLPSQDREFERYLVPEMI